MKKILLICCAFFGLCGFDSLSDQSANYEIENKTPASWEVEQQSTIVKAYNKTHDMELTFYVDNFMPNSPQCLSNKRIRDIKFDIDVYKKAHKGDTNWHKMVERMRIYFTSQSGSEEKRVYGSNLLKNNAPVQEGSVVHIGTLQFLAPFVCEKADGLRMKVSNLTVQNTPLPPLELEFKLTK